MKGFSLIELLICLSLLALCAVFAMPMFETNYHHLRTMAMANKIMTEIHLTRNDAIITQQLMQYTAENWDKMRKIVDQQGGTRHVFTTLPQRYHLEFRNSLGLKQLTFTPMGFTNAQCGSFYLFGPNETIRIIISLSGRMRIEKNATVPHRRPAACPRDVDEGK